MTGPAFKVLSLDGGGLRGAFTAALLQAFEGEAKRPLADHFDLVVGTSTGGIIALAVGLGVPLATLRDFYRVDGPAIFPGPLVSFGRTLNSIWRPKHKQPALRAALQKVFADNRMRDLRTRVVVPTFSGTAGTIRLFKTPHHEHITRDGDRFLVDVALATCAAPYFLPEAVNREERFIDGGLWANNPIAVAVVEAIGYLRVPAASLRVLSVGTSSAPYHIPVNSMRRGLAGVIGAQPVDLVMAAQGTGAHAMAKVLLGGEERILRINPTVAHKRFGMDRPSDLPDLMGLGEHEATHAMPRFREEFLDEPSAFPYKGPT